jgi:hypothetical protein
VQSFEAAQRLDSEDARIREGLERARDLWNRSRQAARLLAESRVQFGRGDFIAAYQTLSAALSQDPALPEAQGLWNEIEAAMERRQRQQRIHEACLKAEGLLLLEAFDDAIAALAELGADASDLAAMQLRDRIKRAKEEEARRQKLRTETALATQWLRDGKLSEAVECLENLRRDFPAEDEVERLLAYARTEVEARTKAAAIEQVTAEAQERIAKNEFDVALSSLERTLAIYPGEGQLIRLVSSTRAAKDAWKREKSVAATLNQCEEL